jgi:hypothetical protein
VREKYGIFLGLDNKKRFHFGPKKGVSGLVRVRHRFARVSHPRKWANDGEKQA